MIRSLIPLLVFSLATVSLAYGQRSRTTPYLRKTDQTKPSEIGLSQEKLQRITDYLQREVDGGRIIGAVAAVSRNGSVGYLEAVGNQDYAAETPMQTGSLFRIASMTKAITSAAVMIFVEDGKVSLDDPLSQYLPGFTDRRVLKSIDGESMDTVPADREPTIHDLLVHRSGLTYGWFGPKKLDAIYAEHQIQNLFEPTQSNIADLAQRIENVPLKFHPGTAWDYGVSTDVLGRVVEVASGLTLDRFFHERLFRPLGMSDTFFHVPADKQDRLADLLTVDEDRRLRPVTATPSRSGFLRFSGDYCTKPGRFYSGGGGLVSSTSDYLRFLHMLLSGGELDGVRVLHQKTVALMTKNQIGEMTIPFPGHGDGFGLGVGVVTGRGANTNEFSVGSYSWGGIFNTYFWVDPQEQLVGVLMTQLFPNDHLTIRDDFRKLAYESIHDSGNALQAFERYALTHQGNAKAGEKLFRDQRTQCVTCHRVAKSGGSVGPELTSVGGKFDRPHLIDSLLYPSRQIGYGYETTIVLTEDGDAYSGILKDTDETHVTLLDAKNQSIRIKKADIEESTASSVSLMPSGLAATLSKQEFTDLITYLESLGPSKGKPGSQVSGPIQLDDGFQLSTVATGLSGAVALEVASDGRVFVCEQGGTLRVIKDGQLLEEPFVTVPVELDWERGLIGVTVAPNFPADPYIYVVYVCDQPYTHHRISRFRADGDTAVPGSEEVIFRGDDQSQFGGKVPAGHQGGGIHFGPDGKLYVGLGEQTAGALSQRMDALQGKILRLNPDGSIPLDNPCVSETTGKYQAIWAKGCRNPFTFAFEPSTGDMLINDVGGKFEEINRGMPGANYGWPGIDHGPTKKPGVTGPIHFYPQSSINGGDFCNDMSWPPEYQGKYFFADFVQGWIKTIDPSDPRPSREFLSGIRRPVDLRFAADGSLYVLLRNAWVVDKKFVGGTGTLIKIERE